MRKVLYFTAGYCGMCKALRKTLVEPLRSRGIEVTEIDCMKHPFMAERYGVKRLPTTIVEDHDGEVYARYEGLATADVVEMHALGLERIRQPGEYAPRQSISKLA